MFFLGKLFSLASISTQEVLDSNSSNTLSFYLKDVFKGTAISSISYSVHNVSGRDSTPVVENVDVPSITGDIFTFSYSPGALLKDKLLSFKFKIVDADGDDHYLSVDSYKVI